jgi:hypothetical protein
MNPRVAAQSVEQLRAYLQGGNPGAGMPAFADLPADDLLALARYLRRIKVETIIGTRWDRLSERCSRDRFSKTPYRTRSSRSHDSQASWTEPAGSA